MCVQCHFQNETPRVILQDIGQSWSRWSTVHFRWKKLPSVRRPQWIKTLPVTVKHLFNVKVKSSFSVTTRVSRCLYGFNHVLRDQSEKIRYVNIFFVQLIYLFLIKKSNFVVNNLATGNFWQLIVDNLAINTL